MTEQRTEERLDDTASRMVEFAERLADEMALEAEKYRNRRLAARRSAQQPQGDTDTATVKPVALEGLPEAEAVMDYKVALLQAVKWLRKVYPNEFDEARLQAGVRFGELLGENVWNALLDLWADE